MARYRGALRARPNILLPSEEIAAANQQPSTGVSFSSYLYARRTSCMHGRENDWRSTLEIQDRWQRDEEVESNGRRRRTWASESTSSSEEMLISGRLTTALGGNLRQ